MLRRGSDELRRPGNVVGFAMGVAAMYLTAVAIPA
jgi:hypothetical protein